MIKKLQILGGEIKKFVSRCVWRTCHTCNVAPTSGRPSTKITLLFHNPTSQHNSNLIVVCSVSDQWTPHPPEVNRMMSPNSIVFLIFPWDVAPYSFLAIRIFPTFRPMRTVDWTLRKLVLKYELVFLAWNDLLFLELHDRNWTMYTSCHPNLECLRLDFWNFVRPNLEIFNFIFRFLTTQNRTFFKLFTTQTRYFCDMRNLYDPNL